MLREGLENHLEVQELADGNWLIKASWCDYECGSMEGSETYEETLHQFLSHITLMRRHSDAGDATRRFLRDNGLSELERVIFGSESERSL